MKLGKQRWAAVEAETTYLTISRDGSETPLSMAIRANRVRVSTI